MHLSPSFSCPRPCVALGWEIPLASGSRDGLACANIKSSRRLRVSPRKDNCCNTIGMFHALLSDAASSYQDSHCALSSSSSTWCYPSWMPIIQAGRYSTYSHVTLAQGQAQGQSGMRLTATYQYEAYAGFHVFDASHRQCTIAALRGSHCSASVQPLATM